MLRPKLLAILAAEIEEGRMHFESRVDGTVLRLGLYHKAIEAVPVEPCRCRSRSRTAVGPGS